MARPPLPLGTYGKIELQEVRPKVWMARCRYRDHSGEYHRVRRYGPKATVATNRLREAVRDFAAPGAKITADTKVRILADAWLAKIEADAEAGDMSWNSVQTYQDRLSNRILPVIGELYVRELSPVILDGLCQRVRAESSASSAKTVKAILGGLCILALRHGALKTNPAREIGRIESKRARRKPATARAMTAAQVIDLFAKLDADEIAAEQDLPDLARFFLGTGERTGEAIGARWEDFDEQSKTITMEGNIIRVRGKGRIRNPGKSESAQRDIGLPDWCVTMLVARRERITELTGETPTGTIFTSSTGTPLEASNIRNRSWNPFRVRAGYDWVTFRTMRKTVVTLLDEGGQTARQIADVVGHSQVSTTQNSYMGRKLVNRKAAKILDRAVVKKDRKRAAKSTQDR